MTTASRTILVGLIGEGIGASLTPLLHTREGALLGFDYEYRTLDLLELGRPPADVGRILHEAASDGYTALNITHPCKQLVLAHLDALTPDAARLGAANLVVIVDGHFTGHNTDLSGFRGAVQQGLPGATLDRVLQVGAGGAGAATAFALLGLGTRQLTLCDANPLHADRLAEALREAFPNSTVVTVPAATPAVLARVDGVVHATPTGMKEHPGIAFELDALPVDAWVAEVVYRPLETELVRRARERGHRVLDGGRMAVGQAVDSIRIITGVEPDAERMRSHFLALLAESI